MKLLSGNLWDSKDEIIFVTTNSYVKRDGSLVMGKGAAFEMKEKFPFLPSIFGDQIIRHFGQLGKYGLLLATATENSQILPYLGVGIFQVKYHFKEKADLELVKYSTNLLSYFMETHPEVSISMNFPAIGYGQRTIEEILPIVSVLPDNISLYLKG